MYWTTWRREVEPSTRLPTLSLLTYHLHITLVSPLPKSCSIPPPMTHRPPLSSLTIPLHQHLPPPIDFLFNFTNTPVPLHRSPSLILPIPSHQQILLPSSMPRHQQMSPLIHLPNSTTLHHPPPHMSTSTPSTPQRVPHYPSLLHLTQRPQDSPLQVWDIAV